MGSIYSIRLLGRRAICPACGGTLASRGHAWFTCIDCGVRLVPISDGKTDRELDCRIVGGGKQCR